MSESTLGYIVLGNGKPMKWIVDGNNYGFYYGTTATVFKNYQIARRRIEQHDRVYSERVGWNYRVLRVEQE